MLNTNKIFLLFEDRINKNRNFLFTSPIDTLIAENKNELKLIYSKIEEYKKQNKYIAGYLSYEYEAEFYVFDEVKQLNNIQLNDYFNGIEKNSYIYNFKTSITQTEYNNKLKKLKKYLKDGETYQTNFTFKANFNFTEDELTLYKSLREKQIVEFGAFLNLKNKTVISLSPELFLQKTNSTLISKPMKGTLKTDGKESDEYYISQMQNDEKTISENLMIVDLIRNDFTKISTPKTVKAENLFEVQKFKTLYQMISTVKSEVNKEISFEEIIEALFPCGSITGAPKKRTMEIINELENEKRGIYTGIIGFITPKNDFTFNIAIRTLKISKNTPQKAHLGIGGGILYDSNIESEWNEALLKSKFIRNLNEDLIILETIPEKNGKIEYEQEHMERMKKSMDFFSTEKHRIRIVRTDSISVPKDSEKKHKIILSNTKINHNSIFRRHKTSKREFYNREYEKINDKYIDIVFFNKENNLAEASRHNVYIEKNGKIYTPFIKDGALPGIIRAKMIESKGIIEKTISFNEFINAEKIYLSNSVNGFFEVELTL